VLVAAAIYIRGGGIDDLFVDASLALLGFGAGVLSIGGPWPLHGRLVRLGLGTLAVGKLSYLAVSIMATASTFDQLGSLLQILRVGLGAAFLGSLITGLSLVRTRGATRLVGSLFLAGMLLLALMANLGNMQIALPPHAVLWALALAVLGNTGVGGLAVAAYASAGWALVSWWPHSNMHRVNTSFQGLIVIDWTFHLTLIAGAAIIGVFLYRMVGREQGVARRESGESTRLLDAEA